MRRIASVFKRADKSKDKTQAPAPAAVAVEPPLPSPAPSASSGRLNTLPRSSVSKKGRSWLPGKITVATDAPPLPALDAHHSSSSSSTSTAASLQTPDDTDGASQLRHTIKGAAPHGWLSWAQHNAPSNSASTVSLVEDVLAPGEYLAALTAQRMEIPLSAPPLLHVEPSFPRSMHKAAATATDSLEKRIHRARVLDRLKGNTSSELRSFGPRPAPRPMRRRLQPDEGARYELALVEPCARGLRRWINRPYFEQRMAQWQPGPDGHVLQSAVQGNGFGVLALEVSLATEILAGDDDGPDSPMTLSPATSTLSSGSSTPVPAASASAPNLARGHVPYKASPSPLRKNANPSLPSLANLVASASAPPASPVSAVSAAFAEPLASSSSTRTITPALVLTSPTPEPSPSAAAKRGVRFTPSTPSPTSPAAPSPMSAASSQLPPDYAERIARQKADKARFLREEAERRAHEAERARHEDERRRWEDERRGWERERRAAEEEKRKKGYADELAAARARRESMHALPTHRNAAAAAAAAEDKYARPQYDERRHTAAAVPLRSPAAPPAPAPRSASSSRAPSTVASGALDERAARASRRQSATSESSLRSNPYGGGAYPYAVPPVPMLPAFGVPMQVPMMMVPMQMHPQMQMPAMMGAGMGAGGDMALPLLPPNAPFMMHGNNSRSRTSSSSSREQSRERHSSGAGSSGPNSPSASSERLVQGAAGRGRAHRRMGSGSGSGSQEPGPRPRPGSRTSSYGSQSPVVQARAPPPNPALMPYRRSTAFS